VPRDDDFSSGPYDLSSPPDWTAFPGLYPPLYTQTPDVFFDWVAPFLPEIELRVLLYLIRRTLGFKKQGDQITIDQIAGGIVTRDGTRLDWGAQLGERSVQRALSGLEAKGLIERHKQLDPERGWRPSYIRLRLCDQSGQNWQARSRQSGPPVSPGAREVSSQTPASRRARHHAGVSPAPSVPPAADVARDTYKIKRDLYTDRQETGGLIPRQEKEEPWSGAATGASWEAVKRELSTILAPSVYQSRVAPTRQAGSTASGEILVLCPDGATSRWLERQLGRTIREIVLTLPGVPQTVRFTAEDQEAPASSGL
jgi:hypothetical protein